MKKKLTAILLCVMMLAASVPTGVVYADEEELNEQIEQIEQVEQIEVIEVAEEPASEEEAVELEVTETIPEEAEEITAELVEIPVEQEEPTEETPAPVDFDVVSAYEYVLTLDEDEIEAYIAALTSEQYDALAAYAMEAAGDSLDSGEIEYGETVYGEIAFADETVNFTEAAPLVKEQPKKKLMKAPAKDAAAPKDVDGLETSKTVTDNGDETYTITLEAYTTGTVVTEMTDVPMDIVLVLDQSSSMNMSNLSSYSYSPYTQYENYTLYNQSNLYVKLDNDRYAQLNISRSGWTSSSRTYTYSWNGNSRTSSGDNGTCHAELQGKIYRRTTVSSVSRMTALKQAARSFLSNVQEQAEENDVGHRIAIVGFGNGSTSDYYSSYSRFSSTTQFNETELLSTASQIQYNLADSDDFADALVYANDDGDINERLTDAIDSLYTGRNSPYRYTYINYGMEMAREVFANARSVDDEGVTRNKVIVVLTDGVPGYNTSWTNYVEAYDSASKKALDEAASLKNNGIVIYTIGIFDNADATDSGSNSGTDAQRSNYFMQHLSSNNGTPKTPSYYLSAGDVDALDAIFQSISEQINTPTISLGTSTVVRDVVTEYFEIPNGAKVSLYTADCTGESSGEFTFDNRSPYEPTSGGVTINDNTVDVTGFDFDANFCAQKPDNTYRGKKLIIEFTVTPKDGFLGGNGVPTNETAGSGVISGTEIIENFPEPDPVDVPIPDFTIEAEDKNVYLNGSLTAEQLVEGLKIKVGDATSAVDYSEWLNGLEDWQQAFVTIPNNPSSDTTSQYTPETALTADTPYTAKVTIAPTTEGDVAPLSASDTAAINVFKPELTFQDSKGDYGTDLTEFDYDNENYLSLVWVHEEDTSEDEDVTMIGDEPTLILAYTPSAVSLTEDSNVAVTVLIGEVNVTDDCTFEWQESELCDDFDCEGAPEGAQFRIHLSSTSLTIKKTGMNIGENAVFIITGEGLSLKITLDGNNGELTVTGLHPGAKYTVAEDGNWSWKYEIAEAQDITLVNNPDENVLEFENKPKEDIHWLTGETARKNIFGKAAETAAEF